MNNRIYKFRAWDKIDKKMRIVTRLTFGLPATGHPVILAHLDDGTDNPVTRSIEDINLLEYTGLKDKNGKEIYEGDIVKILGWKSSYKCKQCGHKETEDGIGVIAFQNEVILDEGSYSVARFSYKIDSDEFELSNSERFEVIGNIWENKNLLDV